MESATLSLLSHEVPTALLHIMVETAHSSPMRSPPGVQLCFVQSLIPDCRELDCVCHSTADNSGVNKCPGHICYQVTPETLPEVQGVIDMCSRRLRSTADVTHLMINS